MKKFIAIAALLVFAVLMQTNLMAQTNLGPIKVTQLNILGLSDGCLNISSGLVGSQVGCSSGGGAPCTAGALSIQYNNAGSFGCTDLTFISGTPNSYSTPGLFSTGGTIFNSSITASFTGLTTNLLPQFTGTGGGVIVGGSIQASDQTASSSATVSGITGLIVNGLGSQSTTGQSTAVTNIFGLSVTAKGPRVANVTNLRGVTIQTGNVGSALDTIADERSLDVSTVFGAGVTITKSSGLYIESPGISGTATHRYGLFIEDQTTGTGSNADPHALLTQGSAPSSFGGPVSVSGTTATWTSGAGAASGNCSVGSLYTNTTAASASTVLYVCQPVNTWTAVSVP